MSEGKIGAIDGDKLIEKLTVESALTIETPEGKGWTEALKAVMFWARLGDFALTVPPRDLTPSEALEEARKRWGRKGTAQYDPTYAPAFRVGEYEPTINFFRIKGEALSFRECFAKADEAQKESK